jgi:hypothetical protein
LVWFGLVWFGLVVVVFFSKRGWGGGWGGGGWCGVVVAASVAAFGVGCGKRAGARGARRTKRGRLRAAPPPRRPPAPPSLPRGQSARTLRMLMASLIEILAKSTSPSAAGDGASTSAMMVPGECDDREPQLAGPRLRGERPTRGRERPGDWARARRWFVGCGGNRERNNESNVNVTNPTTETVLFSGGIAAKRTPGGGFSVLEFRPKERKARHAENVRICAPKRGFGCPCRRRHQGGGGRSHHRPTRAPLPAPPSPPSPPLPPPKKTLSSHTTPTNTTPPWRCTQERSSSNSAANTAFTSTSPRATRAAATAAAVRTRAPRTATL